MYETKHKWSHRYREQTSGYQIREERKGASQGLGI